MSIPRIAHLIHTPARNTSVDRGSPKSLGISSGCATIRVLCAVVGAFIAVGVYPYAVDAQLSAADTTAILRAVVVKYGSHNGHAFELVSTAACGHGYYHGHARIAQNIPCRGAAVDSMIVQYAQEARLRLVKQTAPPPICRWGGNSSDNSGVRLHIIGPAEFEGRIRAGMLAACKESESRGYFHSVTYEIRKVEGEWRVIGIIASIIT